MPSTHVGSLTIYYEEHGSGHPVLLIPGLSNSRLIWWKQTGDFSKKYRVIEMDNRDAGDSSLGAGPYSIGDMADDAAGLIRNLNLGPMRVIGWSMGGFISLELTVRYPELVKKLILVSTSAGGSGQAPPSPEIQASLMPSGHEDIETRVRRIYPLLAGPGYMDSHPEDMDQIVEYEKAKRMTLKSYERQLQAVMNWRGVGRRLSDVSAPVLVIHGDADALVPHGNGQFLSAHIAGARLIIYDQVGHLPPIETPERFNRDAMEFLA
jgi:pimeloyl-ACP methyl ester carboxylesterase